MNEKPGGELRRVEASEKRSTPPLEYIVLSARNALVNNLAYTAQ